jgi:hypothetical protein
MINMRGNQQYQSNETRKHRESVQRDEIFIIPPSYPVVEERGGYTRLLVDLEDFFLVMDFSTEYSPPLGSDKNAQWDLLMSHLKRCCRYRIDLPHIR